MNRNLLTQLFLRLRSESPAFFKKLQVIAYVLIGLGIAAYLNLKFDIVNTEMVLKICNMMVEVGKFALGMLITALTGTTNPSLMDDKTKGNVVKDEFNS